jgi:hypothetical protein
MYVEEILIFISVIFIISFYKYDARHTAQHFLIHCDGYNFIRLLFTSSRGKVF